MSFSTLLRSGPWVSRGGWIATQKYHIDDIVVWLGVEWQSLIPNNIGNQPDISPNDWAEISASAGIQPTGGTGVYSGASGGTVNTGQILISLSRTWDPLGSSGQFGGVPFTTTAANNAGIATGDILNNNTGNNIFEVVGYVANVGTAPAIGVGGFGVGFKVWGAQLLGAAIGKNATAIGMEIDAGVYPAHFTCTTDGVTGVLTNIVVDRAGSTFSVGDNVLAATGIPASTILSITGPANAPTSITISNNTTAANSGVSVSVTSSGQSAFGLVIVGEGGNIGGIGNSAGVGIQIQGQTSSGFGTGLRISSTGLAATSGIGILLAGISSASGIGMSMNNCTFTTGVSLTGGTYTDVILLQSNTATNGIHLTNTSGMGTGINFTDNGYTNASIAFPAGGSIKLDTTTGLKIGTGTGQKIGLWNVTPAVQPSLTYSRSGAGETAAVAAIRVALASWGAVADNTTA